MKLTTKSEYALLALIYIAKAKENSFCTVRSIAESQNISPKYLEQIMFVLKRAKYLRSAKGKGGGFRLAKPADKISLAEIVRLFDGPLAPVESVSKYFYEPSPAEREKKLLAVLKKARDCVAEIMEGTKLSDVL